MDFTLSDADKLYYFQRNWFTLDGMWMVVVEEELGLERTIAIDLQVWERLFPILYRRIKRRLGVTGTGVDDFVRVLAFRWVAEGWTFSVDEETLSPAHAEITIAPGGCPYHQALVRAERPDKIPRICHEVCDPLYDIAAKAFNPKIRVRRTLRQGDGAGTCNFLLDLEETGD